MKEQQVAWFRTKLNKIKSMFHTKDNFWLIPDH